MVQAVMLVCGELVVRSSDCTTRTRGVIVLMTERGTFGDYVVLRSWRVVGEVSGGLTPLCFGSLAAQRGNIGICML